jgi:hypothetical protein
LYSGGLDVANDTNDDEGWGFDDGDGFNGLLLMQLGTDTVHFTKDVGHACLEAGEGRQVHGLLRVVARERLDPASMLLYSAARNETKMTVSRGFKFSVRHIFKTLKKD